jgi:hypothetical protein
MLKQHEIPAGRATGRDRRWIAAVNGSSGDSMEAIVEPDERFARSMDRLKEKTDRRENKTDGLQDGMFRLAADFCVCRTELTVCKAGHFDCALNFAFAAWTSPFAAAEVSFGR